jgi:O-antigen/teichoic acid export membrane protein
VSLRFPPERYAVYSLGATEPPFIGLIPGAIASAMLPTLSNLLAANRFDDALSMFREASRRASLLMLPVFWLCLVNADNIVVLLFGERYRESTPVFIIFLLNLPLRVAIYSSLLRALGRTDTIFRVYSVALSVNFVLCVGAALVGGQGPIAFYGPAVSVVLTTYLAAVLLTRTIRTAVPRFAGGLLPMRELVKVFAVASVAAAAAAATRVLGPPGALLQLVLSTAIFAPTFLALGWATGAIQQRDRYEVVAMLRSLSRPRL